MGAGGDRRLARRGRGEIAIARVSMVITGGVCVPAVVVMLMRATRGSTVHRRSTTAIGQVTGSGARAIAAPARVLHQRERVGVGLVSTDEARQRQL
jgi:hypothetical protein